MQQYTSTASQGQPQFKQHESRFITTTTMTTTTEKRAGENARGGTVKNKNREC